MDAIRAKLCGEGGELSEEELTRYFFALSSSEPVEPLATLVGSVEGLALRQVCQYQFKRGDIAWLCRSCQKDETCVLCNTCWHNSNHEGHEVYYYHSQAGGCCDCGDCGAWNPAGFCSRHGQKLDDPCSCIPDSTLRAGTELIEAIAVETSSYTSFLPSTFTASAGDDDFDGTENWSAVLLLDDMHKPEEFAAELEWLTRTRTLTGADGFRLTSLFKRVGMAAVAVSADLDDVDAVAQHLRSRGYLCSVCSPKTIARRDNLVVAINWLHSLVLLSDAVCRMFSTAISASFRLQALVSSGCYLDKTMMHGLHNLVLSTMADQQFKENLSKAYADSFPALCRAYAMGIGLQECSFFSLSVQYLNRESFVSGMVNDHDFFRNAVLALAEMLDNASAELQLGGSLIDDKCLHFRRYNPLLADLRIIFSILTSNRRFVTETLDDLLDLFSSLSGMHPQTRQLGHHVHFEDRQWIVAFNLYLGLGGLFESLCSWISSSKDAHLNVPDENKSSVVLLSASDFVRALLERLLQWLEGENMDRSIAEYSYVIPSKNNHTFVAYLSNHTHDRLGEDEERHTKSFHYFLHRLFASAILESTKSPALVDLLNSIVMISPDDKTNNGLRDKDDDEGSVFPLIVDHPLDSLAFGAEIKVGLWVRNGTCMRDQLVNYDEVPYCRIFKELDIALLQFFGARTYKNECIVPLVARVFHRYGIYDYILTGGQSDTDTMRASEDEVTKSAMLFEEALLLFLIILTELPQPPTEDLAARALENMRREIIHRACAEHTTFSQLHDCTLNVSDHARVGTGAIERLIREVTVQGGEPALSSMEAPKLSLCPSLWGEYNPVHMHLPARLHQVCIETRPRVLAESPMVLAPPEVHPAYSGFRAVLLSDELLLASVRLHAVGYAAGQVSEHAGSAAKSAYDPIESRMACRESLWSRCLHFLTLIAHELQGADNDFRELIVSFLLFNCAGTSTSAEETDQLTTLKALMDIHQYPGTTKSHSNNMMWLGWVLSRFASLDGRVKAYIDVRNKTRDAEERAKLLETRKQQARERSIQMMRSRAESFAATMQDGAGDDGDDDDVGDSGAQSGGEHDQHEEDEALMCIICHRHTADKDDRLGLQFLSQGSQVCGRLPPRESDTLHTTPNQLPRDQPNLFLSSCKHALHFKCFDIYFADVVAQSEANNGLILDTKVGQFLCPCCKRVANCLVPFHSTRVAERLFKRPRTDDASPTTAAGETGGDVFDLVHTLSVSAKSLQHEPPLLQVEEEHFWTRVLDQVTSPENRHPLTPQFTLSATSCAFLRRLEVAVAAVRYTVRCDMALRTGPGRSIAAKQDAGLDEHAHLSSVIASIGSTMKHAGMVKAMFLDALIASVANPLTGHAFADSVDPNQYQERHPSETFDWLQGFLLGLHRGILSLPTLDIMVMTLACCSDSPETTVPQDLGAKVSMCLSSARLLSIASLVQICVAVVFDRREGVDIHCDVDVDIDILGSIDSFIDHIFESLSRTAHFGSGTPLLNVAQKQLILRKWVAFLRIAIEIIYRSKISGVAGHPDAFFTPRAEAGLLLGLNLSSTYLHALGLEAYLFDDAPHAAATKHMISCWIKSSVASRSIVTLCNRGAQPFDLPVLPKPITFTRLPAAYTTLHAQVKELAPYEFPAICMTCSQILDAGGTGQVTAHCRVCSADGGAAFLLQESVILLLHGDRASYFPSPYIDENGERGKLSRGKPLMWDDRRGALLNTLYAQHELGREVMQKRTSSQRVVIANHY